MKEEKQYTALFAERYILEGFAAFQESANLMKQAIDRIGGFQNLYFDAEGKLHSRLSDKQMSETEKQKLFSMITDSWEIINHFFEEME